MVLGLSLLLASTAVSLLTRGNLWGLYLLVVGIMLCLPSLIFFGKEIKRLKASIRRSEIQIIVLETMKTALEKMRERTGAESAKTHK